jgi:hypothetical protein
MIKTSILIIITFFTFTFAFAQKSNLVFFTEQGEPFYVVLNGIKQNADARTNVKISDLTAPSYKCKIIFKNTALGQLDKTVITKQGIEFTYVIRKNNKDKWLIRWMNETPISNNLTVKSENDYPLSTAEPQTEIIIPNSDQTTPNNTHVSDHQENINDGINDVKISIPVPNVNVNVNMSPDKNNAKTTITTSNQTTKSEINQKSGNNTYKQNNQRQVTNAVPGYKGPYGCNHPLNPESFSNVKTSIAAKSFENSKIIIAKQVISNNCLITTQVKEIIQLFDFESSRLEIAKYAYAYTYDKGNYYQINDAFDFESSINELNTYIMNVK